jgi:hypothetical protein
MHDDGNKLASVKCTPAIAATRAYHVCEQLCTQLSYVVLPIRPDGDESVFTAHVGSSACAMTGTAPYISVAVANLDLKNISHKGF